jgi:hypothetical protein
MFRIAAWVILAFATVASTTYAATAKGKSPLLAHKDWRASIERPANAPTQLVIRGTLVLRTAGYKARLKLVRHLTSNPAIPIYELVLTRAKGLVPQVITTIHLKHITNAGSNPPRYVVVLHHGRRLARLMVRGH